MQIAIDGPGGSGKSTIARALAARLGLTYIDTGAMYRAVALLARRGRVCWSDAGAVAALLVDGVIEIAHNEGRQCILVEGEDVTAALRTAEMGVGASKVSVHEAVREKLVEMQRRIAKGRAVVMDGRDIGTVVLANAPIKIYLDANLDVRARRRCSELEILGLPHDFEDIKKQINARDYDDSNRAASPLKKADDAVVLDTSDLDVDGCVAAILEIMRDKGVV